MQDIDNKIVFVFDQIKSYSNLERALKKNKIKFTTKAFGQENFCMNVDKADYENAIRVGTSAVKTAKPYNDVVWSDVNNHLIDIRLLPVAYVEFDKNNIKGLTLRDFTEPDDAAKPEILKFRAEIEKICNKANYEYDYDKNLFNVQIMSDDDLLNENHCKVIKVLENSNLFSNIIPTNRYNQKQSLLVNRTNKTIK